MGALGLGDTQDRGDDPGEMGDALPAVGLGAGVTVAVDLGATFAPTSAPTNAVSDTSTSSISFFFSRSRNSSALALENFVQGPHDDPYGIDQSLTDDDRNKIPLFG